MTDVHSTLAMARI